MASRCQHCKRICLTVAFYEEHQKVHELKKLENLKLPGNATINAVVGNVAGFSGNTDMELLEVGAASSANESPMEIVHLELMEDGKSDQNTRTKEAYPQEMENDPLPVENVTVEVGNDPIEVENDIEEVEEDPLAVEPRAIEDSVLKVKQGGPSNSVISNSCVVSPIAAAVAMKEDASEVQIIDVVDASEVRIIHVADRSRTHDGNGSKDFTCTHCANVFPSHPLYLDHLFTHFKLRDCPQCKESFGNLGEFEIHMIEHKISPKTYIPQHNRCVKCNAPFTKHKICVLHLASAHVKYCALICYNCKTTFTNIVNYQYHVLKHIGRSMHICYEFCGMVFDNKSALDKHISFHKNCDSSKENTLYQCYICAIAFLDKVSLSEHRYTLHKTLKPFYCKDCDQIYYNEKFFQSHSCFRKSL
ncbi:zinc finger protein 431-like isoform X2 [Palaemon carinicauda]